jgi:glycine dehydrogenase subunit 1
MALMGKQGLGRVAELCLQKSHYAAERIAAIPGYRLRFDRPFFKEFVVHTPGNPSAVIHELAKEGVLAGVSLRRFPAFDLEDGLLIAVTERRTRAQIDRLVDLLTHVRER